MWKEDQIHSFQELPKGYQIMLAVTTAPPVDSRAWVNSVGFPLSEKSKNGIRNTNLLRFCLLASEVISNLDLFSLWVSLWEFPSLLGKLFPGAESPCLSHKSSCPGDGAGLTAGTTCCCQTEAMSAHSKIWEITWGQWKTENTVSYTLTYWAYSTLLTSPA